MVLTKDELISALKNEVRIFLHLISKVDPARLDYRPAPKQRSTLELLQYMTVMVPLHLHGAVTPNVNMEEWGKMWGAEEAVAKTRNLEQVREKIAGHAALFDERIGACSDAALREQVALFGQTNSRGFWLVNMLLSHYAAYRMQLFLYLKASGRQELNTMNLWVGVDGEM